jgi:hypothetical protein
MVWSFAFAFTFASGHTGANSASWLGAQRRSRRRRANSTEKRSTNSRWVGTARRGASRSRQRMHDRRPAVTRRFPNEHGRARLRGVNVAPNEPGLACGCGTKSDLGRCRSRRRTRRDAAFFNDICTLLPSTAAVRCDVPSQLLYLPGVRTITATGDNGSSETQTRVLRSSAPWTRGEPCPRSGCVFSA